MSHHRHKANLSTATQKRKYQGIFRPGFNHKVMLEDIIVKNRKK